MNIFILDEDPVQAAQLQCDKHVVKMIVESAQMLSTAHRMLDGKIVMRPSKSGKRIIKYYDLYEGANDLEAEMLYYSAVHHGHPCTKWTMESSENYKWHYQHFVALCDEYTYRYGKIHKTDRLLRGPLWALPRNIEKGFITPFALAMKNFPDCIYPNDPVKSYKLYYHTKKEKFPMIWTKREIPEWFDAT